MIAGPTAVGKTEVGIELAEQLKTEIISGDSRQLFCEMNLGTAKPDAEQLRRIPHHFISSHSIHQNFDAAQFEEEGLSLLKKLFKKHEEVILVGGSGLYIKALCEGFDAIPSVPSSLREQLNTEFISKGLDWLQQEMRRLDPGYFEVMEQKNPVRLIRALAVKMETGYSISHFFGKQKKSRSFDVVKIGLEMERKKLYERIDRRMDEMIRKGLFEEAKELFPWRHLGALQTVGYQEIFHFMEGRYDRDEAIRLLKRNSRRYAKRQMTWFKKDQAFQWVGPTHMDKIFKMTSR